MTLRTAMVSSIFLLMERPRRPRASVFGAVRQEMRVYPSGRWRLLVRASGPRSGGFLLSGSPEASATEVFTELHDRLTELLTDGVPDPDRLEAERGTAPAAG